MVEDWLSGPGSQAPRRGRGRMDAIEDFKAILATAGITPDKPLYAVLMTTTTAGFLLLPLTVPEVRRLLWALVGQKVPSPAALYWSAWPR
jgi:hypothetical protein